MITVKCSAPDTIALPLLTPFQGDLKKRTEEDVKELAKSIIEDGLLMPFAVWQHEDINYLLDGHGRLAALSEILKVDPSVSEQQFPCILIHADTEAEAKKALLQITSRYGRITKKGAVHFCASIPEYKAPAINSLLYKKKERPKQSENKKTEARIIMYVPIEKEKEVRDLLKQVDYIRIS